MPSYLPNKIHTHIHTVHGHQLSLSFYLLFSYLVSSIFCSCIKILPLMSNARISVKKRIKTKNKGDIIIYSRQKPIYSSSSVNET